MLVLSQKHELVLGEHSALYDVVVPYDSLLRRTNGLVTFLCVLGTIDKYCPSYGCMADSTSSYQVSAP